MESGALVVDGELVDPPAPRWTEAMAAWEAGDLGRLADLGVGFVVDGEEATETGAGPQSRTLGLWLLAGWLAMPLIATAALRTARR